ncbi:CRISPR system precrRNA processing endoribonuclease RAMP protein Cas6 [Nocardiopsis alba]|uniref:CRISPR system precrRNA processing endoribonuclease RAMP protein Cas6 n=1 Tax=Nocardiopsis alba TaxID=53437 RepID=UPI0033A25BB5
MFLHACPGVRVPTQWTLTLTPPPPTSIDPRHLHALTCHLLETPGSEHGAALKPFTTATSGTGLVLSWLDEPTEPDLPTRLGSPARLGRHLIHLELGDRHSEPYVSLASSPPAIKAQVEFRTPTYMNHSGRQLPLPDPELLLSGLARRWSAFSPEELSGDAVTEALGSVHLARHDISTRPVGSGSSQKVGFVGSATFGLPRSTSIGAQRAFAALWSFAVFAGVGAQSTHGLGHVRVRLQSPTVTASRSPVARPATVREHSSIPNSTTSSGRARPWNGTR